MRRPIDRAIRDKWLLFALVAVLLVATGVLLAAKRQHDIGVVRREVTRHVLSTVHATATVTMPAPQPRTRTVEVPGPTQTVTRNLPAPPTTRTRTVTRTATVTATPRCHVKIPPVCLANRG